MLLRLIATTCLLVLVVALNTNHQYFDPQTFLDYGEVLSDRSSREIAAVSEIVDGDTVKLDTGETVRYIGIDTPETRDPRVEVECFGAKASQTNQSLVEGKSVILEKDVSETDRYGRLLRYVYVDIDGQKVMVNRYLVENGYAVSDTHPPDVKYAELFRQAEESAMFSNAGLWAECN